MSFDSWFTYLTGALGVISFLLQVMPILPQYKHIIFPVMIFTIGAFIGSLMTSINGSQISIEFSASPVMALVTVVQIVAVSTGFLCLIAWAFGKNAPALRDASISAFIIFGVLFFVQGVAALSGLPRPDPGVNDQERIALARIAEVSQNWDRALYHYEYIYNRSQKTDLVAQSLKQKINELRSRQYGLPSTSGN